MERMFGIIFHRFSAKSVPGWSFLNKEQVDVGKVYNCRVQSRMFIVVERKYPWTLNIKYWEPTETIGFVS